MRVGRVVLAVCVAARACVASHATAKKPPRRLDTIRSDDGSDDSGDACIAASVAADAAAVKAKLEDSKKAASGVESRLEKEMDKLKRDHDTEIANVVATHLEQGKETNCGIRQIIRQYVR